MQRVLLFTQEGGHYIIRSHLLLYKGVLMLVMQEIVEGGNSDSLYSRITVAVGNSFLPNPTLPFHSLWQSVDDWSN